MPKGAKPPLGMNYTPPELVPASPWPANPNGAVALAIELERMKEQLNDAAMQIAAKQLEIDNLKMTVKECTDAVNLGGVERDVAINEVAEIRGVLKSLAAILIKYDAIWNKPANPKQDPAAEVQS
jgi:hypothetical protein